MKPHSSRLRPIACTKLVGAGVGFCLSKKIFAVASQKPKAKFHSEWPRANIQKFADQEGERK
jgi:hypothetical protein